MRLLIADDDQASRDYLAHTLAATADVETAATADECLARLRAAHQADGHIDLLILDAALPDTQGNELLTRAKQICTEHGCPEPPKAILLTSSWSGESAAGISIQGVDCAFERPQPIAEELLRHTVNKLCGSSRTTAPAPAANSRSTRSPDSLRFLIVDDDRLCREFLKDLLEPLGECDLVVDGHEAIRAIRLAIEAGTPYDLITLDIMMPRMDGHETLEMLRRIEHEHGIEGLSGTKVIMTTALSDSKHCIRAFREGCEAYITKPLHEAELFAKMRDLQLLRTAQVVS